MNFAALTDKGILREKNEDSFILVQDSEKKPIGLILADGMGGYQSGELASKMAVEIVAEGIFSIVLSGCEINLAKERLTELFIRANSKIYTYAKENLNGINIGTTLTCGLIMCDTLIIAHVGDSRAYQINKNIIQLTKDHSYVEELLEQGLIDTEEAKQHPKRNTITRAIGYEEEVKVDIYTYPIVKGDIYLFCTDGLYKMLSEEDILKIINNEDIENACNLLVSNANEAGGRDNITVILYKSE